MEPVLSWLHRVKISTILPLQSMSLMAQASEVITVKDGKENAYKLKGSDIIYRDSVHDIAIIKLNTNNCYFSVALGETIKKMDPKLQLSVRGVVCLPVKVVGFALIDPTLSDFPIQRFSTGELDVRLTE